MGVKEDIAIFACSQLHGIDIPKQVITQAVIPCYQLTPETKVIILSALSSEENITQGILLGANDFVSKPFQLGEFLARVYSCLKEK